MGRPLLLQRVLLRRYEERRYKECRYRQQPKSRNDFWQEMAKTGMICLAGIFMVNKIISGVDARERHNASTTKTGM
ncbi:hypothetical protein Leryth_014822 [Lithospermum erythrorhizon]|nr:hypothetical protein Leryth_014822 [Lithospermum erythrorhizon]